MPSTQLALVAEPTPQDDAALLQSLADLLQIEATIDAKVDLTIADDYDDDLSAEDVRNETAALLAAEAEAAYEADLRDAQRDQTATPFWAAPAPPAAPAPDRYEAVAATEEDLDAFANDTAGDDVALVYDNEMGTAAIVVTGERVDEVVAALQLAECTLYTWHDVPHVGTISTLATSLLAARMFVVESAGDFVDSDVLDSDVLDAMDREIRAHIAQTVPQIAVDRLEPGSVFCLGSQPAPPAPAPEEVRIRV